MGLRTWFRSLRQRVRDELASLPSLEEVWAERAAFAAAAKSLGDSISSWEPHQFANLEYVRTAARLVEYVAGKNIPGLEKAEMVIERLKKVWPAVEWGDEQFDVWWAKYGRPFLDSYVNEVQKRGVWLKP